MVELGVKAAKKLANSIGFFVPEQEVEEMRFGKSPPAGNYIFTTEQSATIKYSHVVTFEFLYGRRYLTLSGDQKIVPSSYVKGFLNNTEVFYFEVPAPGSFGTGANVWVGLVNCREDSITSTI